VGYCIRARDYDAALVALADLSTFADHKGLALEKAAEIYLVLGREEQAIRILEEVITLPGCADAANTLVKLYRRRKAFREIVRIEQLHLPVVWAPVCIRLLREAYVAETGEAPARLARLPTARRGGPLRASVSGSAYATEYAPFSDDRSISDVEYSSEMSVKLSWEAARGLDLTSRVSVRDERSDSDPDSFHAYEVQLMQLDLGFEWQPRPDLELEGEFGNFLAEAKEYDDAPVGQPDSKWLYACSLEFDRDVWRLGGGTYSKVFGSPTYDGYELEEINVWHSELDVALLPNVRANALFKQLQFTGSTEDYHSLTSLLSWYPLAFPAWSLNCGWRCEFRAEDESIPIVGVDWAKRLTKETTCFLSTYFYANVNTREREFAPQLFVSTKRGARKLLLGLSYRNEYNVDKRQSLLLFLKFE